MQTFLAILALLLLPLEDVEAAPDATVHCPGRDDWVMLQGRCYFFGKDKINFDQAMDACLKKGTGSSLVEIDSKEEQEAISKHLGKDNERKDWWIGLTDRKVNGEWKWRTSGKSLAGAYTNWYGKFEPSNGWKEDCVRMQMVEQKWYWNDYQCASKYAYICESGM